MKFPLEEEKVLSLRFLLCEIWVCVFLNPPYGDNEKEMPKPLVYWSQEDWTQFIGLMKQFDAISGGSSETATAMFQTPIQTCQLHCMLAPLRRELQEQFRQKKEGHPEVDSSIVQALSYVHGKAVIFVYNDPTTKASVSHLPLHVFLPFSVASLDTSTNATYPIMACKFAAAVFEAGSTTTAFQLEDLKVLEALFRTPVYDLSHLVDLIKTSVQQGNARIPGAQSCLARLGYGAPLSSGPQNKTPGTAPTGSPFQPPPASDVAKKPHRRRPHRLHHQTTPRSCLSSEQSVAQQRPPPKTIEILSSEEDDSSLLNASHGGSRKSNQDQSSTKSAQFTGTPPDEGVYQLGSDHVTGKRLWSEVETNCVKVALQQHPDLRSNWVAIKNMYGRALRNRTSQQIKDKVRNLDKAAAKGK